MASFGAVTFTILDEGQESMLGSGDWTAKDFVSTKKVPTTTGANSDVTFLMGVGAEEIKHKLLLANQTDWAAFKALRQTIATFVDWDGTSYADVLLYTIELPYRLIDDREICQATFRKTSGV